MNKALTRFETGHDLQKRENTETRYKFWFLQFLSDRY